MTALLSSAVSATSCAPREERVSYDLIRSLPIARIVRETTSLDIGTEHARPALLRGWSWNESHGELTFVWSRGRESVLMLSLHRSLDRRLALTLFPYAPPGAPRQQLVVLLNGKEIRTLDLAPGRDSQTVQLKIGREHWLVGDNQLVFRYRYTRKDIEGSDVHGDLRDIAVGWDRIEITPALESAMPYASRTPQPPAFRISGRKLYLAGGVRVDYSLDLVAGSTLAMDQLRGDSSTLLVVRLQQGDAPAREVARLSPSGRLLQELPIRDGSDREPAPSILTLLVDSSDLSATLELDRPRIVLPKTSAAN